MSHTNRYHELKKLSIFLRRASEIVERMAENEDLPIFDVGFALYFFIFGRLTSKGNLPFIFSHTKSHNGLTSQDH